MNDTIRIQGARENNLKNVNLTIPRDKLVVFTVVIENNGSIISRDVISDLHTTEFRMMLTLMIKVMQEIPEGSDIVFLTNAAYIQNFDKAPPSYPNLYEKSMNLSSESTNPILSPFNFARFTPTLGIIDHSPTSRFCALALVDIAHTSNVASNLDIVFIIIIILIVNTSIFAAKLRIL